MDLIIAPLVAVHLLIVNVASAGPLVCMWLEWRAGGGCDAAERACRMLSRSAFHALLVGGILGGLLLAFVWSEAYVEAIKALGSKIAFGVAEYGFSLVLMGLHAFLWTSPAKSTGMRLLRCFILLLAGTNLLYHFPFLFTILSNVANGIIVHEGKIDSAQFRQYMIEGDVLPRSIHFILASFAVTGVFLFAKAGRIEDEKQQQQVIRWGGQLALTPTLIQILVGMWIIMRLPRPALRSLMGSDVIGTVLLVLSVLLAFWLMHLLAKVALGKSDKKGRGKAAIVMTAVVVLMCGVSQRIKHTGAAPPSDKPAAESTPAEATPAEATPAPGDELPEATPGDSESNDTDEPNAP